LKLGKPKEAEMEKITFAALVEKALKKPSFFDGLKSNPVKTLKDAGLKPTPEVLVALKNIDYDAIKNLAIACDPVTGPLC
jgi:hypothetical protein